MKKLVALTVTVAALLLPVATATALPVGADLVPSPSAAIDTDTSEFVHMGTINVDVGETVEVTVVPLLDYIDHHEDALRAKALEFMYSYCQAALTTAPSAFWDTWRATADATDEFFEFMIHYEGRRVFIEWGEDPCAVNFPAMWAICIGTGDSTQWYAFGCVPID
jgi:hypothetical protein